MKKTLVLMLSVVMALSLLAGCGSRGAPAESDVIKIGVFEPMTGANAAGGEMTVEGIQLANEKMPEILGKKVELVIVDNKSDKVEAANAANKLIEQDKVVAIIGSYGSSLSMAAGDIVKTAQVPAVGCSPTNPLVTLNNDFYFRVCFIDPFQGTVMANYAFNELGARTAAIIQDVQQDYSVGLSKYFVDAFTELTGDPNSIVATVSYNTGDQDFSAQLTSVKGLNPDVIFAPGNYGESALLIKQARDLGMDTPILGGDTWEAPEFLSIGGAAVEGAVFSTHFTSEAPVTEVSEVFLADYQAKYGKAANAFAALGYDAYMVILDAIERAGSADSVAIQQALAETEGFVGATGNITLDENGDAVKSAVINKVEGGKFVYLTTVEP
ncbi:MAG TPA: branched-chain amino acid ABC transporter substrate-binding protein [Tissierellales bacterium]|nr:branched-chain amino acid ABC transporter substrate-binding protein [Tissierellales bacterium]